MIVSMMYSIKTRKIRRNKIRLHNWSVKEHQERGSDLISSGYVSRLRGGLLDEKTTRGLEVNEE
jgi:hypothetical protein